MTKPCRSGYNEITLLIPQSLQAKQFGSVSMHLDQGGLV